MQDFEKLDVFCLGKRFDPAAGICGGPSEISR